MVVSVFTYVMQNVSMAVPVWKCDPKLIFSILCLCSHYFLPFLFSGDMGAEPLVLGSQSSTVILNLPQGFQHQIFASAVDNVGNQLPFDELVQNTVLIDFPLFEAVCLNNCSGRGNCTTLGTCTCSPGYYGSDCSKGKGWVHMQLLHFDAQKLFV